jgi:hypothetical protein
MNVTWLPGFTISVFGFAPLDVMVTVSIGVDAGDGEALDEDLPHATIVAVSAVRQNPIEMV